MFINMKKIIIAFLAILFGVNAMSQSYDDTIDFMPRQPNYYYNDWWVTPWVDTSDGILYHGYASECFLRYNYTDRPLKIVGLAAALFVLRNTPPWGLVFDSMETDEYLLLCDARPDTFVRVEQVQWNITDSHHYIQITTYPGYVDYGADCCRNGSPTEIVLPLYTYYFDKPVIVNDSFYIGNTDNFSWTHSDPPHQYDGYRYSEGVSSLEGPPPNRIPPCSYDSPSCLPILQKYRHEYWDYDGRRRVSYRYLSGYTLIFPIVEHPDCLKIRTVQADIMDSGRVRLSWRRDSLPTGWEVAWGVEGTPPDSCSLIPCSNPEVVLDSLETAVRYVAYIRSLCHDAGWDYYSDWSDGTRFYIPNRFTVTAEANHAERGRVDGGGVYEEGQTAVLSAQAWIPYRFKRWNDGDTSNPKRLVVTQDTSFTAIFGNPLGTDEPASGGLSFRLMPNPAGNSVQCILPGKAPNGGIITVVDATGHKVLRQTIEKGEPSTLLHVDALAQGMYFVTITTTQGSSTQKLTVKR